MQIIRIIFSKRFYVNSFVRTVSVDEIHQMTITIHKLQLIHFHQPVLFIHKIFAQSTIGESSMLLIYCLETSYLKKLVSLSRSLPLCRIGANSIDVQAARVSFENKELSAATQFPLNADFEKYK